VGRGRLVNELNSEESKRGSIGQTDASRDSCMVLGSRTQQGAITLKSEKPFDVLSFDGRFRVSWMKGRECSRKKLKLSTLQKKEGYENIYNNP